MFSRFRPHLRPVAAGSFPLGHEISHAFDNNGAHFDENGNLSDWWKEEDFKKFEELTKGMIEQFDGIPFHGGKVNGKLVVSENIADAGGMAVTIEIMHGLPDPDFKAYFLNWGRIWCLKAKESYISSEMTCFSFYSRKLR